MAESLGKATFALEADIKRFKSDMQRAKGIADSATKGIGSKFKRVGAGLQQAGTGLSLAVTAPIVAGIGLSAKAFLQFDQSLNRIRFLTNATAEDLPAIEKAVLDIARATGTLPEEAAGAFYFALSSGAKDATQAQAILSQTLIAANMGLGEAEVVTRAVLSVINAYGLEMDEATIVTGQFVEMIEGGLAEPDELAQSLNRVLSIAKNLNIEIPELFTGISAITVLTGASGPRAISKMAGIFRSLLRLSPRQREMFEDWESDIEGVGSGMEGLIDLVQLDFAAAMKAIFDQFDGNTAQIKRFVGNVEALDVVLSLGSERGQKLFAEGLENMSTAGADFLKKQEAFRKTNEFQLKALRVDWQITLIEIGRSFVPVLIPLTKVFKAIFKIVRLAAALFGKLPKPIKIAILAFLLLAAALGPILLLAGLLLGSIGGAILGFTALGVTVAGVTGFLAAALPIIGLVAIALLALGAVALLTWLFFEEVKSAVKTVLSSLDKLGKGAFKIGSDIITGVTRGVISATGSLFRAIHRIAQTLIDALNPFKWVFGSLMIDTYDKAGMQSGRALTQALHTEAIKAKKQTVEDLSPDTKAIEEDFEETGEAAGEAVSEGIVRAIADANLVSTIGRAIDAGGIIAETFRIPIEAMRNMVSDLTSELDRLAGLPSIESAAEDLEKAEATLKQLEFKQQIRQGAERIKQVDKEIRKLVDQRNVMVFLARGRTLGSDAIDVQLRSLVKEKKEIEKSIEVSQEKSDVIQEEIDVLDRLGETRDLEREILVARAKAADKTLASDAEIIAQLEKMEGVVGAVTSELSSQVSTIQTEFLPAWGEVVDRLNEAGEAGAGGAGAGGADELEFPEFGELDPFGEAGFGDLDPFADLTANLKPKIKKFLKKMIPIFVGIGIALIAAILLPFTFPVLVVVAVGILLGILFMKFQKPLIKFFKKLGEKVFKFFKGLWKKVTGPITDAFDSVLDFLKKNWPEIVAIISGPFFPIVALATDVFGIRSAIIGAFKGILKFVEKLWGKIEDVFNDLVKGVTGIVGDVVDAITGAFDDTIDWITKNWADVIAEIILAPLFFIRVGADDLWGIRTAMFRGFNAVVDFVIGFMITIKDTILRGFQASVGFVKDAFNEISNFIIDTLTALPGQVLGLALSIGTTIFNAILEGLGFLAEIHSRVIGALTGILTAIPSIALSIGKAMFDGITSGLSDIAEAVWEKIPSPLRWLIEQLSLGIDIAGELAKSVPGVGTAGDILSGAGDIAKSLDPTGFFKQRGAFEILGSGNRDTEVRALTPGEMVLPRDSAQVLRDFFEGRTGGRNGGGINVTVHNPQPEAAEDTVRRQLQALAQLGAT